MIIKNPSCVHSCLQSHQTVYMKYVHLLYAVIPQLSGLKKMKKKFSLSTYDYSGNNVYACVSVCVCRCIYVLKVWIFESPSFLK